MKKKSRIVKVEKSEKNCSIEAFEKATGVKNRHLQLQLVGQAHAASNSEKTLEFSQENFQIALERVMANLTGIQPRNELEGMLAVQLTATHNLAMEFLSRSMQKEMTGKGIEFNVGLATKLLRLFTSQVETLNRYRNQGQQKVVVEHVTVNAGGKAVVGVVEHKADTPGGGGT